MTLGNVRTMTIIDFMYSGSTSAGPIIYIMDINMNEHVEVIISFYE